MEDQRIRIPPDMAGDRMLSVQQIAELDGISEDTVRREIAKGKLKAVKLSARRIGVRTSDYRAARTG
jgi:excisionase family DNA binding protein